MGFCDYSSGIAERILIGDGLPPLPGGFTQNLGAPPDPALRAAIIKGVEVIGPLAEEAARLPQAIGEQNLGQYLAAVLALIEQAPNATAAHALLDPLIAILSSIEGMIEYARRAHIPVVSGSVGQIFGAGQSSHDPTKKADGGMAAMASGTDTVAALLTPGEYVVNAPRAADLGPNFLHALNDMRIPREELTRC
jgi:hypothetical protein